jgi:hypothetical protein
MNLEELLRLLRCNDYGCFEIKKFGGHSHLEG